MSCKEPLVLGTPMISFQDSPVHVPSELDDDACIDCIGNISGADRQDLLSLRPLAYVALTISRSTGEGDVFHAHHSYIRLAHVARARFVALLAAVLAITASTANCGGSDQSEFLEGDLPQRLLDDGVIVPNFRERLVDVQCAEESDTQYTCQGTVSTLSTESIDEPGPVRVPISLEIVLNEPGSEEYQVQETQ